MDWRPQGRKSRLIPRMLPENVYFAGSSRQATGQPASLGPMIELMGPDGGGRDDCQLDSQLSKGPIANACRV